MSAYTIIVPDGNILARVCGTNDCNLKLIEEFLALQVFAQGNELSIETDDQSLQQQFREFWILQEFSLVVNNRYIEGRRRMAVGFVRFGSHHFYKG